METSNSTGSLAERLKDWRSELKGLGLTKDDRDELQGHMEDILEELQAKGLSEEEAWIMANRRIGEARDIRREFMKMENGRIPTINHVLFWLMLCILGFQILAIGSRLVMFLLQVGRAPGLTIAIFICMLFVIGRALYKWRSVKRGTRWLISNIILPNILAALLFGFIVKMDGPECQNSNNVIQNNSPRSEIYKAELVKLFAKTGTDNLYYRFGYAYSEHNKDFIVLSAIGKDFCGYFSLDVTNSERMTQIVKNKGLGYRGSLWKGVEFDTFSDKSGTRFIFKSVETIVD